MVRRGRVCGSPSYSGIIIPANTAAGWANLPHITIGTGMVEVVCDGDSVV